MPFTALSIAFLGGSLAGAQVPQFGGNAQHTNNFSAPAATMNKVLWETSIDDNPSTFAHYGAPVVTASNTVLIGHKTATQGYQVDAYDSAGNLKYTVASDYVLPSSSISVWKSAYQPVLVGTRLYFPAGGGKVNYIDNVDASGPHTATTLVFYGASNYAADQANFDANLKITTPITADSAGNIYFGFQTTGTVGAPMTSNQGGIAKITAAGVGSWVNATNVASDPNINNSAVQTAPALSNDEQTLYVVVRQVGASVIYLAGLNPSNLSTKYKVLLKDPRNTSNNASLSSLSTSSPMVGPDGDVYFGLFGLTSDGSRGFVQHFSGDLATQYPSGGFGWDYTPGVVPASMVPSYHGTASYLLFCKYNNYSIADGDGVNRVALLDPHSTQTDFHATAPGVTEMRVVLSIISPSYDIGASSFPHASREWCINAACVNPSTNSIIFNNEDGYAYRWDTVNNVIAEGVKLNNGIGQPYVPTIVGPDGTIYTINGGKIMALGGYSDGSSYTVASSAPEMRSVVVGTSITFTAQVHGGTGTPTGTFDFFDDTNNGYSDEVQVALATGVPVNGSGIATVTTSALSADGGAHWGNHRITAVYSGDAGHETGQAVMIQKIHAYSTSVSVGVPGSPAAKGDPVALTATVSASVGTPTGYVCFRVGNTILGQSYLDGTGLASLTTTAIPAGNQTITAEYESDTYYAYSSGTASFTVYAVNAISFTPIKFASGGTTTGTITLSSNAPVGGTVVTLSSNNAALTVPPTVTVPAGTSSTTFVGNGTNNTYLDILPVVTATIGASSVQKTLIVQPNNKSSFVSQSVPTTMAAGATYSVSLVFKNQGGTTWDTAHGYKLLSQNPANNTNFGLNQLPLTGGSVAPLANGTFSGTVTAPATPGNYNFQWICFEGANSQAFGPVSGNVVVNVVSSLDNAQFVSQTPVPTSVGPSTTFTVQFVMKNTGASSWTAVNNSLASVGSTNFGVVNIASPTVAPNANGTFPAAAPQTFTAPSTPGSYTFQWRMRKGTTFFGQLTPLVTIVVSAADASQYISRTGPLTVNAGSDFSVSNTMKNTGVTTWSSAAAYSMMSVNPNNNTVWGTNRLNMPGATNIGPGAQTTFTGICVAPITPGTYTNTQQWQVCKNGVPFGEKTPLLTINVVQGPDNAEYVSTSAISTSVGPSTTFNATITMKNRGTATWDNTYSLVAVPSGSFGVTSIASGSVAPTVNGTFSATFTAPATPGTYSFRWRMSHGGVKFGQATPAVNIVVSADAAQFLSRTGATTVNAGADFTVSATMKNTGTTTWTVAAGYSMMSLNPNNNTTFGANKLNMPGASNITPGNSVTFSAVCTAPVTPGSYPNSMQWQMNKSGTPFGEKAPAAALTIVVVQGPDNAVFMNQTVPGSVVHGATFSATIVMQNTGTGTWGGTYSLVAVPTGSFGVTSIVSATVVPNANGTFTATFTAPATPGTYSFRWRMSHSGVKFGQATPATNITVT